MTIVTLGIFTFQRLLLLLLLMLSLLDYGCGLRISGMRVPEVAVAGTKVTLTCSYEPRPDRPDPLYSIKWYRGVHHFYEYIPTKTPPVRIFPLPNVRVDESRSHRSSVTLTSVTPETSGTFRCEVVGEKPHFETDDHSQNMTVVEVPEWGPEIQGPQQWARVQPEELVRATCRLGPSNPPAKILWLVNGESVPPFAQVMASLQQDERGRRRMQVSELHLRVEEDMFRRGLMTLSCEAKVSSVYNRQANVSLVHVDWSKTAEFGRLSSGSSLKSSIVLMGLILEMMGLLTV